MSMTCARERSRCRRRSNERRSRRSGKAQRNTTAIAAKTKSLTTPSTSGTQSAVLASPSTTAERRLTASAIAARHGTGRSPRRRGCPIEVAGHGISGANPLLDHPYHHPAGSLSAGPPTTTDPGSSTAHRGTAVPGRRAAPVGGVGCQYVNHGGDQVGGDALPAQQQVGNAGRPDAGRHVFARRHEPNDVG